MRARHGDSAGGRRRGPRTITVFSLPREPHRGLLCCGPLVLRCALGRAGVTHLKREGDGATPAGRMRLVALVLRPDGSPRPRTVLPARAMHADEGWCDDPLSGSYNRPIRLPARVAHERLWREDSLYDIVGILAWNIVPRVRGRGSAIFLHLARPDYAPTAGCVALARRDLRLLLQTAGRDAVVAVDPKPRKRSPAPRRISIPRRPPSR